jgi:hypothetical protein
VTAVIALHRSEGTFLPKDRVAGYARWDLEHAPRWLEVRIAWHTEGKGTKEHTIVGRERWQDLSPNDRRDFVFTLPEMPYTYHGRVLSILWSVDLIAPSRLPWRREERVASAVIIVSPTLRPYGEER